MHHVVLTVNSSFVSASVATTADTSDTPRTVITQAMTNPVSKSDWVHHGALYSLVLGTSTNMRGAVYGSTVYPDYYTGASGFAGQLYKVAMHGGVLTTTQIADSFEAGLPLNRHSVMEDLAGNVSLPVTNPRAISNAYYSGTGDLNVSITSLPVAKKTGDGDGTLYGQDSMGEWNEITIDQLPYRVSNTSGADVAGTDPLGLYGVRYQAPLNQFSPPGVAYASFQYVVSRDDTSAEAMVSEALVAIASVNDPPVPNPLMSFNVTAGNHSTLVDFSTGADPVDDDEIASYQIVTAASRGALATSESSNLTGAYTYTADPTTAPGNGAEVLDTDTLTFKLLDSAGTVSRLVGRVNVTVLNSLRATGGAEFRNWQGREQLIYLAGTDGSSSGRSIGFQVQPGSIGRTVGRIYRYDNVTGSAGELVCNTLGGDGECADPTDTFVFVPGNVVVFVPEEAFANRPNLKASTIGADGDVTYNSEWAHWCLTWLNASVNYDGYNADNQLTWPKQCGSTVNTDPSTAESVPADRRLDVALTFRSVAGDGTLSPPAAHTVWVDDVPSAAAVECGSAVHGSTCATTVHGRTDALSDGVPLAFTVPDANLDDTCEWMVAVKGTNPNGNFWIAESYRTDAALSSRLDFNARTDDWCVPVQDRFDGFTCEGADGEPFSTSRSMVFYAKPSDIKTALEGLTYYWSSDEPGEDVVTVTVFNTMLGKAGSSATLEPSIATRAIRVVRVGAEPTNAPTQYPTISTIYKVSSDMTLSGFLTAAEFTLAHRTGFQNAMATYSGMPVSQVNITRVVTSFVGRQLSVVDTVTGVQGEEQREDQRRLSDSSITVHYVISGVDETQRGFVPAKVDELTTSASEVFLFVSSLSSAFAEAGASVPSGLGVLAAAPASVVVQVEGEAVVPIDDDGGEDDCVDTTGLGCKISDCEIIGCQIPWVGVYLLLLAVAAFALFICARFAGGELQKSICCKKNQYQAREGFLKVEHDGSGEKMDKWVVLRRDTLSHHPSKREVKSANKSSPNVLALTDGTKVRDHGSTALFMVVSEGKVWKCTASSMDDKNKWILAIEQNGRMKNMSKRTQAVRRKEKGTKMMQWMSRKSSLFGAIRRTSSVGQRKQRQSVPEEEPEDVAEEVTEGVAEDVTEDVTEEVTEDVTEDVTVNPLASTPTLSSVSSMGSMQTSI
jgi:hypothetical protein